LPCRSAHAWDIHDPHLLQLDDDRQLANQRCDPIKVCFIVFINGVRQLRDVYL
jgi:hypothetical protein